MTVLGNLIDNAVEAVADRPGGRVAVTPCPMAKNW